MTGWSCATPLSSLLRAFDGARPPPPGPLRLRAAALRLTAGDARPRAGLRAHLQGEALPTPPQGLPLRRPGLTPLSAGLQDADAGPAPLEGSTQTPAAPLSGANVSCSRAWRSRGLDGGEDGRGRQGEVRGVRPFQAHVLTALVCPPAQVFSTVTAVSVPLLPVLPLLACCGRCALWGGARGRSRREPVTPPLC